MASKHQLRKQRTGSVINVTSAKQESDLFQAMMHVEKAILEKFGTTIALRHTKRWYLKDIVSELRQSYAETEFHCHFDKTYMQPDGGILYLKHANKDFIYPILIAETKNQGTNDLRVEEGLKRQAKGNAIERLGKNLIGLRIALKRESIFPFVCFGYGCDFDPLSTILDRVSTMAMFGKLNITHLHDGEGGIFDRGSFYFREEKWGISEMTDVMTDIAIRSVLYYFSKYGESNFKIP